MRIGYDAKRAFHNSSGLGNYSRDIIRLMTEYYPDNNLVLYNPKKGNEAWLPHSNNLSVQYPDTFFGKLLPSVWRQTGMIAQIERDGIDIFHGLSNEIPRGIDRKKTKTIVTIHDLLFIRFPELYKPVDRKIYLNKFSFAAKNADLIIAISEQTKRDIIEFLHCPESKIVVHYQGCHPAFKQKYTAAELLAIKQKYNLPETFILNVGTLEKRKNAGSILKAVKESNHHVVLVGRPTDYVKHLQQIIQTNRMQDRVHLLTSVPLADLAVLYQAATVFCYPSIFEGFGIPIIESLFSCTPVITSAGSCFAEAGGPDSVYVVPNDVAGLQKEIDRLMADAQERVRMAEAGMKYVQRFQDEQVAANLMRIYNQIYINQ